MAAVPAKITPSDTAVRPRIIERPLDDEVLFATVLRRTFRALPMLLICSTSACLIARYGYHITGGHLVVAASVPLLSLFVVSRVLVALVPYQATRRVSATKSVPPVAFVTVSIFALAGIAAATFGLSALMFSLLHVSVPANNAWSAMRVSIVISVVGFLLAMGGALYETAWPMIRSAFIHAIVVILSPAIAQVVECFLYTPTGFVDLIRNHKPQSKFG
jgi:hypothetical protein